MKKIRMGVVGVGGISGLHIGGTLRSSDAELTAICDTDPDTLRYKGELYGIPEKNRFTDYRQLIASPDVDAVSNCTPNNVHLEVILETLRAGKPIMTEKPMTMDSAEAELARRAAKDSGAPSMIGFTYRFLKSVRFARHLVLSGELGKIFHAYGEYKQAWGNNEEGMRVWRFDKAVSGTGALGDLGSHTLDLISFITGAEYTGVSAQMGTFIKQRPSLKDFRFYYDDKGRRSERVSQEVHLEPVDVDDYCHIHAQMDNGSSAALEISRYGFGRGNYQRLEIYGSKGALVIENDADDDHKDKIKLCVGAAYGMSHSYNYVDVPKQFVVDEMQCFFNKINGKGDGIEPTIDDGYRNMVVLDACVRSSEENGVVIKL